MAHRTTWRWLLGAMLLPLAVVAFWPAPVDEPVVGAIARLLYLLHAHGIPAWFNYKLVEACANVAFFIPLGAVTRLAFPEKQWWQVAAFGLLVSGCIELGQLLFLHNRFASPLDLVTNTGGAIIGVLLAVASLRLLRGRRTSKAD